MNTKTTLCLAVVLAALISLFFLRGPQAKPSEDDATKSLSTTAITSRNLSEKKLSDVVKVVYKPRAGDEWVFEKNTEETTDGSSAWRMTAPRQMPCVSWQVERFGRQLGDLKYELSYKPGEPGALSAKEAGLDPPEAVVTLTDTNGQTLAVEIGRPGPNGSTYVRLAGTEDICVGRTDLSSLLKNKLLDYREKRLWSFDKADATRVEIVDRSKPDEPVDYVFVKDGARWMMESPVTARATSKVDDMLDSMSRQSVVKWHEDDASRLAVYGLDPGAWTVRVTVEEEVPPAEEKQDAAATDETEGSDETDESGEAVKSDEGDKPAKAENAEPQTKVTTYTLHISKRTPIGEETMVYVRPGDEPLVGTISKIIADKFKPVMSEWREMRLTLENVQAATRIELTTPAGSAGLVKEDDHWSFEADGGRAEDGVIADLLKAVADVRAVVFIDNADAGSSLYGFEKPQAELRLTIPGVDHVERITVGGYTDAKTRRLVYVRRNELASVAKVRTPDVAKLIAGPRVYRDRTIVEVLPSRFRRINLSYEDVVTGDRSSVTLARAGNVWSMAEPTEASINEAQVDKLVESLGGLRAEQVVAEGDVASAYGLHAPAVTLTLTYGSAGETAASNEEEASPTQSSEEDDATVNASSEPTTTTMTLAVTEHEGKVYAKRSDRPTIYEVPRAFYTQLLAEYRTDRIFEFDDAKVTRFSVRQGDDENGFIKQDDQWRYTAEPDLPLDSKKVTNLLLQIRDLRTKRYVAYAVDDLSGFGLDTPAQEVTVTLDDGTKKALLVSSRSGRHGADQGFFARLAGQNDVFLLTADTVKRFHVDLDELE